MIIITYNSKLKNKTLPQSWHTPLSCNPLFWNVKKLSKWQKKKAIELATFWPAFHPEQREYELSSLSAAAPDPDRGDEAGVKSWAKLKNYLVSTFCPQCIYNTRKNRCLQVLCRVPQFNTLFSPLQSTRQAVKSHIEPEDCHQLTRCRMNNAQLEI